MPARYFAYGSNMDEREIGAHCPSAVCLGAARLDEHRLAFTRRSARTGTGVADVVVDRAGTVWGAVWEMQEEDLAALDVKEGEGHAYARRQTLVTLRSEDAEIRVHVYSVICKRDHEVTPSREYLMRMISAAEAHGLPRDYVAALRARPFEA